MQKRYLTNVQQLRGIAAFVVLLAHVVQSAQKRVFSDDSFLIDGGIGVDIFFVISGFIMVGVTHDAFGQPGSSKNFAIRRIARIIPVYWILTALMAALFAVAGQRPALSDIVASFVFFPLEHNGRVRPILGQGWTLELEMMFYAIFTICLMFRRWLGLLLLCASLCLLAAAGTLIQSGPFKFWTSPIILEFLIGILIGLAYRECSAVKIRGHLPIIIAIVLAWICMARLFELGGTSDWRILPWTAAGAVVAIAVFSEQVAPKGWLITLGDWSYSLYLIHIVVLLVLAKISDVVLGARLSLVMGIAYTAVVIAASLLAAGASYRFLERPMERLVRNLLEKGHTENDP